MNQLETKARDKFRAASDGRIKVKLIENQSGSTADTACINRHGAMFWIEYKALEAWPKRDSTLPLRDAFRPGQIPFLKEWKSWGGIGYVLLKAGADWWLLNPKPKCRLDLPQMTRQQLSDEAVISRGLDDIIDFLKELDYPKEPQ